MPNVIVCDDFVGDPLADIAASLDGADTPEFILLSDFLDREGYYYDRDDATLRRRTESLDDFDDLPTMRILDRVVELSPRTVDVIGGENGVLQRGQILDRYRAILTRHKTPVPDMRYSTVGRLHPLPTQWYMVDHAGLPVATPVYRYGYGPTPIDTDDLAAPIFKSPFDLYKWKPNQPPEQEGELWDQFAADLPAGVPVLTYFLGETRALHFLKEVDVLPPEHVCRGLFVHMDAVAALFGNPVAGEVLWYVDGEDVTFAAFSHFLSGAAQTSSFAADAEAFFRSYFS